jgi:glycerol kinase
VTLARAYRPLRIAFPAPGRVEQDPVDLWERSREVIEAVLRAASVAASDVAGIGIVAQRATTIAWDARSGEAVAPAIGWQDQRTAERVAGFRKLGIPLTTLPSATKFEWMLQHEEGVRRSQAAGALRLGTPDVWLGDRLSGGAVHATDPGNASCTALYDLGTGDWADGLIELFGVDAKALPRVVPTSAVVGETPAALFGASIPIAARAGDQQAATFAQGVHAAGEAKLTLGTSAMLDLHTGDAPVEAAPGTYALALWKLGDGSHAYCVEGTVITAGAAVDWLASLGVAADAAGIEALAAGVATSAGVVVVPALQGLGTPWLDDAARGSVFGLTRGAGRAELARAVLEGVAQRCVDVCEALDVPPGPLRVDGGLGQSDVLCQALADLSGREVLRAAETETTALGAAFLAGLATGVFADPAACRAALDPPERIAPSLDADARSSARSRWARAVEAVRGE